MLEFLAVNFNLPTVIGSIIVFGGTGWILYRGHKSGSLGCCDGSCGGSCSHSHGEASGCGHGCSGCANSVYCHPDKTPKAPHKAAQ